MRSEEELLKALKEALSNEKNAPFRISVKFSVEELQDAEALGNSEEMILSKIISQLRPDTSEMNRVDIELLKGNIPDWVLEKIDHIEIEHSVDEATFSPQKTVCLYIKDLLHAN